MADEIATIADTTEVGEIITTKPVVFEGSILKDRQGNIVLQTEVKRADMLEHRKLRIESRKWLAAKLIPKVYGDKLQVDAEMKVTRIVVHDELPGSVALPALPKPEFEE